MKIFVMPLVSLRGPVMSAFPLMEVVVWGTHNLDLGKQNPNHTMWSTFNPNLKGYVVPSEIIDVVGGG